jgi:hypothetical protein
MSEVRTIGRILFSVSLFLVLISILNAAQPVTATVTVQQFVTCKGIDESKSPFEPIQVTDTFWTTDEKVWALLVFGDIEPPFTVRISYFRPSGIEQARATHKFTAESPSYSYAVYLEVATVTQHTGKWRVEAYVNADLVSTVYFTLSLPRPLLSLADTSIKPGPGEPVHPGDVVTVTYTLQNVGAATATRVEVRAVDSPPEVVVETSAPKDLPPGSSDKWQVNVRAEKAGEFIVSVSFFMSDAKQVFSFPDGSEKDTFTITLTVSPKPAFLVLHSVMTEPSASEPFYVGDIATITYALENTGELAGKNVEIRVVSAPAEIEIVQVTAPKDLLPSAEGDWQVELKASKPGTYEMYVTFYVDGEKVIFQVEGETGTIEQFKTTVTVGERPFLETYGLYLIAVVAVAVVAVVLMMRRRGRAAVPPSMIPSVAPATPAPPASSTVTEPSTPAPNARKFCINCGAPMPVAVRFCPKCGAQQP